MNNRQNNSVNPRDNGVRAREHLQSGNAKQVHLKTSRLAGSLFLVGTWQMNKTKSKLVERYEKRLCRALEELFVIKERETLTETLLIA